jgi:hypothetical protein
VTRLEHGCAPPAGERGIKRFGDDAVRGDLAREGLVGREPRRLVGIAQQALLGDACLLRAGVLRHGGGW